MLAKLVTSLLMSLLCCCCVTEVHSWKPWDLVMENHSSKSNLPQNFDLTSILFTYTEPDPSTTRTTLKMCSDQPLSGTIPEVTDPPVVVFEALDGQERAVAGVFADEDKCALFEVAYLVPEKTAESTTYSLVVHITSEDGTIETLKTSTVNFAMTVSATLLQCDSKQLTRIAWTDPFTTIVNECLEALPALSKQCYMEGDLSGVDICFHTPAARGVEICRNGGVAVADAGQVSVNYLAYEPASPDLAHLSLMFNDATEKSLEVTLWEDSEDPSVLSCDGTICGVTHFVTSNSVYEMCAFLEDVALGVPQSGYAFVQDVSLVAYGMGENPLFIEFGFINSNADSFMYIASLLTGSASDQLLATVHLDCAGVAEGHTCYGFIAPPGVDSLPDNAYVSVEYTYSGFGNPTNRIAAKVQPLQERSRNLASLGDPAYSFKGSKPYGNNDA